MNGARSAGARPRKRAARTVARDRVVAASTTGRGREVRRGFISLEILPHDDCHSKTRARARAAEPLGTMGVTHRRPSARGRRALRSGRHSVVVTVAERLDDGVLGVSWASWKSAAWAVTVPSLPFFLARRRAARHALSSPSSASVRGGTRLAIPALMVT